MLPPFLLLGGHRRGLSGQAGSHSKFVEVPLNKYQTLNSLTRLAQWSEIF